MGLRIQDQAFIQYMLSAKALSEASTVEAYNNCVSKANGQRAIKMRDMTAVRKRIEKINDSLNEYGLQFKTIFSPWENVVFWGLCNTLDDIAVPLSSVLKKNENAAFFDLIEVIQVEEGLIPLVTAHSAVAKKANMPIMEAANLIQKLNQQKWLKVIRKQSGAVNVTFGARALLELPRIRSWLMRRNADQINQEPKEEQEEEEQEELDPESEDEITPADPPRGVRQRRPSRRLVLDDDENDDDDVMEIEPAPEPTQSKRPGTRSQR